MRTGPILLAALLLSGCLGGVQGAADQLARAQARTVVDAQMSQIAPGVDVTPLTDCVINNASAQEILIIAGGVTVGNTSAASDTIGEILRRPRTARCTANAYVGDLLGAF